VPSRISGKCDARLRQVGRGSHLTGSPAAKTVRELRWFEIQQIRGHIKDDEVAHWQVTMKVGFALDD
jgi:hypothetical protein